MGTPKGRPWAHPSVDYGTTMGRAWTDHKSTMSLPVEAWERRGRSGNVLSIRFSYELFMLHPILRSEFSEKQYFLRYRIVSKKAWRHYRTSRSLAPGWIPGLSMVIALSCVICSEYVATMSNHGRSMSNHGWSLGNRGPSMGKEDKQRSIHR